MEVECKRADVTPKRNHDGRELIYACVASVFGVNDGTKLHISLVPHERLWSTYDFSSRGMAPGFPRSHAINTYTGHHENWFSTLWYLSKNLIYYFIRVLTLERFHVVTQNYAALFSIKTHFCETKIIFYFKN